MNVSSHSLLVLFAKSRFTAILKYWFTVLHRLKNSEAVYPACRKRRLLATYQCSLTVNGGVASLIAWLDHSCHKTEVGGKQGHAPCRKISLQQIPMHGVNPAISAEGTTPDGN